MGKDSRWKHPRAPAVRKLWKEKATDAVLEFLEDMPVGHWLSTGVARAPREEVAGEGAVSEGEQGGPGISAHARTNGNIVKPSCRIAAGVIQQTLEDLRP